MYKKIYIPLDNSVYSNFGIEVGALFSKKFNSEYTGSHVYAAALHDSRFKQMEGGLPEKYKVEDELFKQRDVHNSLIDKGLKVISDSFLDIFEKKCTKLNVPYKRKILEGKNFQLLVDDINESNYDLVIIGILGLGAVKESIIGSVCERVVRRVKTDILVTKKIEPLEKGKKIVVGIDGSPQSYSALKKAITIAKTFDLTVDAVSAFDPYYHYVAFNSIVDVLSEEASEIFKFEEQEKLHEEIIDSGLAKIYQNHLDLAKKVAKNEDFSISTTLLDGKPFEKILKYIKETNPWMVIVGRIGIHCENGMDIGSNTENLLRLAPCNVLISNGEFKPSLELSELETSIAWTKESEQRIQRIPSFAQGMAKKAIIRHAVENGYTIITSDVIDIVMGKFMPNASGSRSVGSGIKKPIQNRIHWSDDALFRLKELAPSHLMTSLKLRVEKFAKTSGNECINRAIVEKVIGDDDKKNVSHHNEPSNNAESANKRFSL